MINFFGGASGVTGSCYLLTIGTKKILIDCGMEQEYGVSNAQFIKKINAIPKVDVCFLTHAHVDHSGLLPLLVKKSKVNKIYSSLATKELCGLLYSDIINIQTENQGEALYSEEDVKNTFAFWDTRDTQEIIYIDNIKVTFYNSSHIIGSVSIFIETTEGNYLFSGDLGTKNQQLMDYPPEIPDKNIDYLLIESTYGDKIHAKNDKKLLIDIVNKICLNGGKVLIPAFAIGRLQEVLYALSENNINFPIYIDTPMGTKVTNLLEKYSLYLKKSIRKKVINNDLFNYENLTFVSSATKSKELAQKKEACVIISASGMLEGGRVLNHLATIKDDINSAIIFVGYQANNTRGRKILDKEENVACELYRISSFSAHADREEIILYVSRIKYLPYKIYVVHGENNQRKMIAQEIEKLKIRAELPENLEKDENILEQITNNIKISDKITVDDMSKFNNFFIKPFVGYMKKDGSDIEFITKEEYNDFFSEVETEVYKNFYINKISEQESEIQHKIYSEVEITKNIELLKSYNILTKGRMQEFWEKLQKGVINAQTYIKEVHLLNENTGKRRWQYPLNCTEEETEKLFNLTYETMISCTQIDKNLCYNILYKQFKIK